MQVHILNTSVSGDAISLLLLGGGMKIILLPHLIVLFIIVWVTVMTTRNIML